MMPPIQAIPLMRDGTEVNWLSEIRMRFESALGQYGEASEPLLALIRPAQDPRFGDYQANMAMPLGKKLGRPPRKVAAEIVDRLDIDDLCEAAEIAGPGFINLKIREDRLAQATGALAADDRLGVPKAETPRNVVIDFSSPNVAKPMHVGHLRSTVIGDALSRIYRFLGHRVIGDNHVGDWGTQFGMILYGYKHFLEDSAFEREPVTELARLYRLVNQVSDDIALTDSIPALDERISEREREIGNLEAATEAKETRKELRKLRGNLDELRQERQAAEERKSAREDDPERMARAKSHPNIAVDARRETAKLHAGDQENLELWRRFLPLCLEAIQGVYDRLGIRFDHALGESFYQPLLEDVATQLKAEGIATESEGALCVFNEGFKSPFIIRKADGAFLYATTDLATIRYRLDEWNAEDILYVVDKRQSEHFEQLFATARRAGAGDVRLVHVSFGTILGEDRRPFKTRAGDVVGLESLLEEAVERAYAIVSEGDDAKPTGAEWDEPQRRQIAEIVGLGGIKFADLKHNRESDYVFRWQKMLSTTGDSATYMQYAYARIAGIARRGGIDLDELRAGDIPVSLGTPQERALALRLNRFAEAVEGAGRDARPNVLTEYLFGLAGDFTSFYDACPVLKADSEELRLSRLVLCDVTARVIARGLDLLGIAVSERM